MFPPMKRKRANRTAVITGNVIVVMGGFSGKEVLDSVEYFDFDYNLWVELPPMNEKRWGGTPVMNVL